MSNFPSLAICAVELFCLNFAALDLGPSRRWLECLGRHDYVLADRSEIPLQPNHVPDLHGEWICRLPPRGFLVSQDRLENNSLEIVGFEVLGTAAQWARRQTMDDSDIILRRML